MPSPYLRYYSSRGLQIARKPTYSLIDKTNPLTENLIGAFLLNESATPLEKITSTPATASIPSFIYRKAPQGAVVDFNINPTTLRNFSTKPLFPVNSPFTIMVNINVTTKAANNALFATKAAASNDLVVYITTTGINFNTTSAAGGFTTTIGYNVNEWHQIVVTWNGAVTSQIYFDGRLLTTDTVSNTALTASTAFDLGVWADNGDYFRGLIDYCYVWNKVIPIGAVQSLYRNPYQFFVPHKYFYSAPPTTAATAVYAPGFMSLGIGM